MIYDVVVIGAGLAGFSAALSAVKQGKEVLVVAKGMGNLYSASGYIDLLGYYPATSMEPTINPQEALEKIVIHNSEHPYSYIGKEHISQAVEDFIEASGEMGIPYTGSLQANMLMPSAIGALVPTAIYPLSSAKNILEAKKIVVVGIKELMDFYPTYAAHNLQRQLKKNTEIKPITVELGLNFKRELNSYDLALALEEEAVHENLIKQLKDFDVKGSLVLIPAILGVHNWQQVINTLETSLECEVLEVPTLPPSVMGYRLAEAFKLYLQNKGVDFLLGYPVTHAYCREKVCKEIAVSTVNERLKMIKGKAFVLATGGILGEGLQVYPKDIKEDVFSLPVAKPKEMLADNFFDLEGQLVAYAGVAVNKKLQPINNDEEILLKNVFVAGATLAGYDPFVEKSGNGVALATGYKAGLLAAGEGIQDE